MIRNDLEGLLVAGYVLVKCTLHGIGMATMGTDFEQLSEVVVALTCDMSTILDGVIMFIPRESRSLCRRELELYRLQGSSIGDNICCLRWIPRAPCFGT